MCLIIDRKRFLTPLVAYNDIECYKVMEIGFGGFKSPFMGYRYEFGVTVYSKISVDGDYVNMGLHSYVNAEDAFKMSRHISSPYVVRCIIPNGSTYYVGSVDTGYEDEIYEDGVLPDGYVSDSIRIVDMIFEEN